MAKSTEECVASMPGVFLHFVHKEYLWAFAPDGVRRWAPSKSDLSLWEDHSFRWDFGEQVIVPDLWLDWLSALAGTAKSKIPLELQSSFAIEHPNVERANLIFDGTIPPKTRKFLVVQPLQHYFRGENIVFLKPRSDTTACIKLWGLSVGHFPQMNPRKNATGKLIPWPASDFQERELPVNLRFDTCAPLQNMSLDVENVSNVAIDVLVIVRGIQLLAKKNT